jgi:hypothetical protein
MTDASEALESFLDRATSILNGYKCSLDAAWTPPGDASFARYAALSQLAEPTAVAAFRPLGYSVQAMRDRLGAMVAICRKLSHVASHGLVWAAGPNPSREQLEELASGMLAQALDDEVGAALWPLTEDLRALRQLEQQAELARPAQQVPFSPPPLLSFSADFRSVRWGSEVFIFSDKQATVVRTLSEAREKGTPEVHYVTLLDRAESRRADAEDPRLRDLFRDEEGKRAWGKLIIKGTRKGHYRLADPPD